MFLLLSVGVSAAGLPDVVEFSRGDAVKLVEFRPVFLWNSASAPILHCQGVKAQGGSELGGTAC